MRSGDVVPVDFGNPVGSTPALVRPAVVVTADSTLDVYDATVHVVPFTSNVDRRWAIDVVVGADDSVSSAAQCHLLAVVDQNQIVNADVGNVGPVKLLQSRSVIADLLDLPI